jgi:PilZ domain-containing protein
MVSVYSSKRKEPRVKLSTRVRLTVSLSEADGISECFDTKTIDVSPRGASVSLDAPLALGTVVHFAAQRYQFATRAAVRSITHDRSTATYIVGLEYLDDVQNPIVVWQTSRSRATCKPSA